MSALRIFDQPKMRYTEVSMEAIVSTPATFPDDYLDRVICGDCRKIMSTLPEGIIQTVVTSPPYWGLRDYGIDPVIWGGEKGCRHEWGECLPAYKPHQVPQTILHKNKAIVDGQRSARGQFCQKCNAWLGVLGLEPSPELYVEHLVEIFRQVRRQRTA